MEVEAVSRSEQVRARRLVTAGVGLVLLVYAAWQAGILGSAAPAAAVAHGAPAEQAADHAPPPPPAGYSMLPFAALLLCIAILPLSGHTAHWWEKNLSKLLV